MTYRLIALISATAIAFGGCSKRKPTLAKDPPKPVAEEVKPGPPPDSLQGVGWETVGLVKIWVTALGEVETEESAAIAAEALGKVSEQFGYLVERAEKLPKLNPEEFKLLDAEIDPLLSHAGAGLEKETQRIFLLPEQIRSKVLPAHRNLMKQFQDMSRAIRDTRAKPAPEEPIPDPPQT